MQRFLQKSTLMRLTGQSDWAERTMFERREASWVALTGDHRGNGEMSDVAGVAALPHF